MMRTLIVSLLLVVPCCLGADSSFDPHWDQFKGKFLKDYPTDKHEDDHREHFENNLKKVAHHNLGFQLGLHSYEQHVHEFSDKPYHESVKFLCGTRLPTNYTATRSGKVFKSSRASIPASKDWVASKAVTSVKSQGSCGSCWTFAAAGAIEGQLAVKGQRMVELSEQQLVDCSTSNSGCDGGWPDTAFDYIQDDGIQTYSSYKYIDGKENCKYDQNKVYTYISGHVNIEEGDEAAVAEALANHGPLSVAIHVSDNFMNYKSGIYYERNCPKDVNHGVLLVGYGSDGPGKHYWKVKNSWGPGWGEKGYIRMARNKNNLCAVASYASYPEL